MRLVKGVIQVVGNWNVPATPADNPELRLWYWKVRPCHIARIAPYLILSCSIPRCSCPEVIVSSLIPNLSRSTERFMKQVGHFSFCISQLCDLNSVIDEPQPIKLLLRSFNRITTYIPQMLDDKFIPN